MVFVKPADCIQKDIKYDIFTMNYLIIQINKIPRYLPPELFFLKKSSKSLKFQKNIIF